MQPETATVISLTQLGYPRPSIRDAIRLAQTINRRAGLNILSLFNLCLSWAAIRSRMYGDRTARESVQKKLFAGVIAERRLAEIKSKIGSARTDDTFLLHRAQTLVSLKLVVRYGQRTGGNDLLTRDDFDVIGELALVINSLHDFGLSETDPTNERQLAPILAPSGELENPPRLDYAFARSSQIIGPLLEARRGDFPIANEIERVFLFMTGFSFQAFWDMTYALFAYYATLKCEDITQHQGVAYFNPFNPDHIIAGTKIERFLESLSVGADDVSSEDPEVDPDRYLLDFTEFRARPFLRWAKDSYMCVDPCFLAERIASSFYWSVMNGLDSDERREAFSSLWGGLFEAYVIDLLRHMTMDVYPNPRYANPDEEAFDALVLEKADAIAVEAKGPFVPVAAKYSARFLPFFRGLTGRFGNKKRGGIHQLARNMAFSFGVERARTIQVVDLSEIRNVFPVLVTQEPILGFGLASKLLTDRFNHRVKNTVWRHSINVFPATILHVADLETMAPLIRAGKFTLGEYLREKRWDDREGLFSVHDHLLGRFLPRRGLTEEVNELIGTRFKVAADSTMARFRAGEYR